MRKNEEPGKYPTANVRLAGKFLPGSSISVYAYIHRASIRRAKLPLISFRFGSKFDASRGILLDSKAGGQEPMSQSDRQEIKQAITEVLDLNAHNWLAEDFPNLYALVKSEVEAGRPKEDILRRCAQNKEVNNIVLSAIAMAIDHLTREAKS
jgi:hypothetical protein